MPEQKPGRPDPSRPLPAAQRPAQASAGASEPTLLAVDGTGLLVRCSMASKRTGLHSSDGTPTGALLMFISTLAAKIRYVAPESVIICWDGEHAKDWRRKIYPGYKANRDGRQVTMTEVTELTQAMKFTEACRFPEALMPGFEADDMMAAVWRARLRMLPLQHLVLCTEDKDMLQLLGYRTVMLSFSSNAITAESDVERQWRVSPPLLPWVRALAGDPSDGISGLSGIGPKKAARMVAFPHGPDADGNWTPEQISALLAPAWPYEEDGDAARVVAWHSIMDLRNPARYPEEDAGHLPGYFDDLVTRKWHPSDSVNLSALQELLDKYELRSIRKRLNEGRLW